eukprot:COSAG05_NODE_3637_length_1941_cov_1.781759_2_plen_118_part_00
MYKIQASRTTIYYRDTIDSYSCSTAVVCGGSGGWRLPGLYPFPKGWGSEAFISDSELTHHPPIPHLIANEYVISVKQFQRTKFDVSQKTSDSENAYRIRNPELRVRGGQLALRSTFM